MDEEKPTPAPVIDTAVDAILKFVENDADGRAHGIVNPNWMKKRDITLVGQFIKHLLESDEMKGTGGWIGIKYKKTEFGNPRIYYYGKSDVRSGKLESNMEYMTIWYNTNLVRMPIEKITYTDVFGKIDFIISLQGKRGDKVLSKVLESARKMKVKYIVSEKSLEAVTSKVKEVADKATIQVENGVATIREGVVPAEVRKPDENVQTSV